MVKIQNQNGEDWKDREKLKEAYDRLDSQRKVAEEFETTRDIIRYWMNKFDIERDSPGKYGNYRHLKPYEKSIWENGYAEFRVKDKERRDTVRIHRLLAIAEFGVEAVKGMDIHHKNHCPFDNRRENLEVVSRAEHNSIHGEQR